MKVKKTKMKLRKQIKLKKYYKNFYIKNLVKSQKHTSDLEIIVYDDKIEINNKTIKLNPIFFKYNYTINLSFLEKIKRLDLIICTNKIKNIIIPNKLKTVNLYFENELWRKIKITGKGILEYNNFLIYVFGENRIQLFPKIATKIKVKEELIIRSVKHGTRFSSVDINNFILNKKLKNLIFGDILKIKYKKKHFPETVENLKIFNQYCTGKNFSLDFEKMLNNIKIKEELFLQTLKFNNLQVFNTKILKLIDCDIKNLKIKNIDSFVLDNYSSVNGVNVKKIKKLKYNLKFFKPINFETKYSRKHQIFKNLEKLFYWAKKMKTCLNIYLETVAIIIEKKELQENYIYNMLLLLLSFFTKYYLNYEKLNNKIKLEKNLQIKKRLKINQYSREDKNFYSTLILLEELLDNLIDIFENSKTKEKLKIELKNFFDQNLLKFSLLDKNCLGLLEKFHIIKNNNIKKLTNIKILKI